MTASVKETGTSRNVVTTLGQLNHVYPEVAKTPAGKDIGYKKVSSEYTNQTTARVTTPDKKSLDQFLNAATRAQRARRAAGKEGLIRNLRRVRMARVANKSG